MKLRAAESIYSYSGDMLDKTMWCYRIDKWHLVGHTIARLKVRDGLSCENAYPGYGWRKATTATDTIFSSIFWLLESRNPSLPHLLSINIWSHESKHFQWLFFIYSMYIIFIIIISVTVYLLLAFINVFKKKLLCTTNDNLLWYTFLIIN